MEKESAPSSLAYSLSSRRQTGLNTIYKERVRPKAYPNPARSCYHLVGDYLKVNLIRIMNTQFYPTKILALQPSLTSELGYYHNAPAKIVIIFDKAKEKSGKFWNGKENGEENLLAHG